MTCGTHRHAVVERMRVPGTRLNGGSAGVGWGADLVGGIVDTVRYRHGEQVGAASDIPSGSDESFDSAIDAVSAALPEVPRPEGINGADIFSWFHDGAGTGSLDDAVAGWNGVSRHQEDAARAVHAALTKLDAVWEGAASATARAGADSLRRAADRASETATRVAAVMQAQSEDFERAKKQVLPVPAEAPQLTLSPPVHPLDVAGQAERSHEFQAQQRRNRTVLDEYATRTSENTGQVPVFADDAGDVDDQGLSARFMSAAAPVDAPVVPAGAGTTAPTSAVPTGASKGGDASTGEAPSTPAATADVGLRSQGEPVQSPHLDVPGEPVPPRVVATPPEWRDSPPWADDSSPVTLSGGQHQVASAGEDAPCVTTPEWSQDRLVEAQHGFGTTVGVAAGSAAVVASGGALFGGAIVGESAGTGRGVAGASGSRPADRGSPTSRTGAQWDRYAAEMDHDQPEYLVEANPHEVFGSTEPVGPAVLGAAPDEPVSPEPETK